MGTFRVLYTGKSVASQEAEECLRAAGIEFMTVRITNPEAEEEVAPPHLLTTEGEFPSLDDIKWYAKIYGSPRTK